MTYLGGITGFEYIEQVFSPSFHLYTESLLSAVPHVNPDRETNHILLEESIPSSIDPPSGCLFRTHCPKRVGNVYEQDLPGLGAIGGDDHYTSCHPSDEKMSQCDSSIAPSKRAETSPVDSD